MNTVGFTFEIRPELKDEFKKAHDEIWPELVNAMKDVGIHDYSEFFKKDGTVFVSLKIENFEELMNKLGAMDVNTRWQNFMEKYFVKNDKSIIGPEIEMLENVFYLE